MGKYKIYDIMNQGILCEKYKLNKGGRNKKTRLSEFSPQPRGTPKGDYENSLFEHVVYLIW